MIDGMPVDRHEKMQFLYKLLQDQKIIEWHCEGRHGVIRSWNQFNRKDQGQIAEMLVYYFGSKCMWVTKGGIEFVHMTKVFPGPKNPWGWCGETVLFQEAKNREETQRQAVRNFGLGDKVSFVHKGEVYRGIVSGTNKRVAVIVDHSKWYVPATQLIKELE